MMGKVDAFLDSLINYDKENIHENCLKAIRPYLDDPEFDPEFIRSKSSAAAGMCSWVRNMARSLVCLVFFLCKDLSECGNNVMMI